MAIRGVHSVRAKGKLYHYAWRAGPRLHEKPGTDAFLLELANARAARIGGDQSKISGLIASYKASEFYTNLSPKTREGWIRWLDQIQIKFGNVPISAFESPKTAEQIEAWRNQWAATPRTADVAMEVMSRLLWFARKRHKLKADPCKEIDRLYEANRAALIWTAADLEELERRASKEIMWAARLAALTGLRRGDLLRLSWSHVKPLSIEIATGKSGGKKTTLIPIYGELRTLLDAIPRRATTVLTNQSGLPWATGFGSAFGKAKRARAATKTTPKLDAIPLHFHDLRGTAATKFYVSGLTIREIAGIMTWGEGHVEALIDRYVKRDEILLDRIRRLDENARETASVKPSVKPASGSEG